MYSCFLLQDSTMKELGAVTKVLFFFKYPFLMNELDCIF